MLSVKTYKEKLGKGKKEMLGQYSQLTPFVMLQAHFCCTALSFCFLCTTFAPVEDLS